MAGVRRGLVVVALLAVSTVVPAQQERPLEDVLQGFEDEEKQPQQDEADEDRGLQDILEGFEEPSREKPPPEEPPPEERPRLPPGAEDWTMHGALIASTAYNYAHDGPQPGEADYRGFSRLRFKYQTEVEVDIAPRWDVLVSGYAFYDAVYDIHGQEQYTQAVLDTNATDAELMEAYVRGTPLNDLDVKLGRQIIPWGKSDTVRVVDVLNPLDNREPLMADIEDFRLPVTAMRADYYFGDWSVSGIVIPEIRFNKMPAFGSDFYPFAMAPLPEHHPRDGLENAEYAVSLSGIFTGWDLALHAARVYEDLPHVVMEGGQPVWRHSRLTMVGGALALARGNWVLKGEAAYFHGLEFAGVSQQKARVDAMVGADYAGIPNALISLEVVNRRLLDFVPAMAQAPNLQQQNSLQLVLRATRDLWHDRLHLLGLASVFEADADGGGFFRYSAEYDWTDRLATTVGLIAYASGGHPFFGQFGENDRLFAELRYSY